MAAKILIVDDEAPIRTLLRAIVASPGFAVFEADGGSRALEIAVREAPFSLVVTDILMPGMDGFQLAEQLTRAGYAKDFLFISGFCDQDAISDRLEAFPGAGFLSKPFPIPVLLEAVRRILVRENGADARMQRSA